MIAAVSKTPATHALELLPDLITHVPPRSEVHAVADVYEQWLVLQQTAERVLSREDVERDIPLARKAYAIGHEAEAKLRSLRTELSALPSTDLGELARKARIMLFDASTWLDEGDDPLFASFCDDALRLAGWRAITAPYPLPRGALERLAQLDFDAPPLPWEDDLEPTSDG